MGIESDQVVYEYLSRVGDVAQQRQLSSATRMRLVAELRNEIDRRRSKSVVDSPAAVRRILDRLGSPDEIVDAAGGGSGGGSGGGGDPREPAASVPPQRDGADGEDPVPGARQRRRLRRAVPRPRPAAPPARSGEPSPPHLASAGEYGGGAAPPDWWRVDDAGPWRTDGGGPWRTEDGGPWRTEDGGPFGADDGVPGFVGGVEIPELLKPPPRGERGEDHPEERGTDQPDGRGKARGRAWGKARGKAPGRTGAGPSGAGRGTDAGGAVEAPSGEPASAGRGRRLPRLWPAGGTAGPLLLLAAALLVAGAVLGHLVPLGLGWLIAYLSRRLSPAESKWAVLGLPGAVAAAGLVWLWGRADGRWGEPIAAGRMGDAVSGTWPWVLRGAAVASASYLVWRARRPRT